MTAWPERVVRTWRDFTQWISEITLDGTAWHGVFFRGQADWEWSLLSSLARILTTNKVSPEDAAKIEHLMINEFRYEAYRYLSPTIIPPYNDRGSWLMLMQHHRAPTRLLDWTASPYVAAYFAVADSLDKDGAIWCFSVDRLTDAMKTLGRAWLDDSKDMVVDPADPIAVHTIGFDKKSDRMVLQQGGFTLCNRLMEDYAEVIPGILMEAFGEMVIPSCCMKVRVPADAKHDFLANLRFANITGRSIFEGADGVGLSVREYAVAWPAYKRAANGAKFTMSKEGEA